jgi:hypothetical protein
VKLTIPLTPFPFLWISLSLLACDVDVWSGRLNGDGGVDSTSRIDECGNGLDDDQDGLIDDGCPCGPGETQSCFSRAPAHRGVGSCRDGVQTCRALGAEWGDWGNTPCEGEQIMSVEQCDNMDHDCDGALDDGCPCIPGQSRTCGRESLPAPCKTGTQTCGESSTWSECVGAVEPTFEVCRDGIDNDCDGEVDDLTVCVTCRPVPESCNNASDDDCDGTIDEPACHVCIATGGEGCGNAFDDDCDGEIDEGCAPLICRSGTGFDLLDVPGRQTTSHGLQGPGDLASTAMGWLLAIADPQVSSALDTMVVFSISTNGNILVRREHRFSFSSLSPMLTPGCGGMVATTPALESSRENRGYFVILREDGTLVETHAIGPIGRRFQLLKSISIGDGLVIPMEDRIVFMGCDGMMRAEIPVSALRAGVACPANRACVVDTCVWDGSAQVACLVRELDSLDTVRPMRDVERSLVLLDTTGSLNGAPVPLFSGEVAETFDLHSCGADCFEMIRENPTALTDGSQAGAIYTRINGRGALMAAPEYLRTSHLFARAQVVWGDGFILLKASSASNEVGGWPATEDLFVFDRATRSPLFTDSSGRAFPLPLPPSPGGCGVSDILGIAPSTSGPARVAIYRIGWHASGETCADPQSEVFFLGCNSP